jgi:uncharacterized membrane protein
MSTDKTESSFYNQLKKEAEIWQAEGIIVSAQKESILARYRRAEEIEKKAGSSRLITTISVLGSVLIGVGLILFIASNWSEITREGKLGIIFGTMLLSYIIGFYLRYETKNYPKIGASLILLGSAIFGAGIFLIAQIYNITVHYPNGPLMWGLAILPMAYLLRFKSILMLALIVLCVWLGMELPFHTTAYPSPLAIVVVFLMSGIMLWCIGLVHKGIAALQEISMPYILTGIVLTFACAFAHTFGFFGLKIGLPEFTPFYFSIVILFALAIIVYTLWGVKEKGGAIEIGILAVVLAGFFILAVYYPEIGGNQYLPYKTHNQYRLIFNIVFAAGIIGIIISGYVKKSSAYINIGLLFFVLDVIARYFDFFWKMLPRSLFFIGGGIILLAGGIFLERKRRMVLQSFGAKEETT